MTFFLRAKPLFLKSQLKRPDRLETINPKMNLPEVHSSIPVVEGIFPDEPLSNIDASFRFTQCTAEGSQISPSIGRPGPGHGGEDSVFAMTTVDSR